MSTPEKTAPETLLNAAATAAKKEETVSRRSFFTWLAVAWGAFAAALGIASTATVRFLFRMCCLNRSLLLRQDFRKIMPMNKVDERWKEKYSTWIVRTSEIIYALSTTCTHLGCTPNWLESESKFKCPCHGSGFYMTGINFEGPAPRPLERWRVILGDDGQIVIDKSKKFQWEKGEWTDPDSFIRV